MVSKLCLGREHGSARLTRRSHEFADRSESVAFRIRPRFDRAALVIRAVTLVVVRSERIHDRAPSFGRSGLHVGVDRIHLRMPAVSESIPAWRAQVALTPNAQPQSPRIDGAATAPACVHASSVHRETARRTLYMPMPPLTRTLCDVMTTHIVLEAKILVRSARCGCVGRDSG